MKGSEKMGMGMGMEMESTVIYQMNCYFFPTDGGSKINGRAILIQQ